MIFSAISKPFSPPFPHIGASILFGTGTYGGFAKMQSNFWCSNSLYKSEHTTDVYCSRLFKLELMIMEAAAFSLNSTEVNFVLHRLTTFNP